MLKAADFKAKPSSHDSCFNCHWKAQQPTRENCQGCHTLSDNPYIAVDTLDRKSMKFRHTRDDHVIPCTSCHINITKPATVRASKPDVPIITCASCHNGGTRQDVTRELESDEQDPEFICSYCHTADVGKRDAPANHYLIANKPAKRKDLK